MSFTGRSLFSKNKFVELEGEITAETARVDGLFGDASTARAALASDIAANAAAHAQNASDIAAEASARISAIAGEASARTAAIGVETAARVAAVAAEASARAADKAELEGDIAAEASARATAVSGVQSNLDAEVSARGTAVAAEASARATAVAGVQSNIDGVDTRLTAVETDIGGRVQQEIDARVTDAVFQQVKSDLEDADSTLTTNLGAAVANELANHQAQGAELTQHDGRLGALEAYLAAFSQTYELLDQDGNAVGFSAPEGGAGEEAPAGEGPDDVAGEDEVPPGEGSP